MANSYKFEISRSISSPFVEGELFQRKHFYFDSTYQNVSDKSLCKLTAKNLWQMDFGINKNIELNDTDSLFQQTETFKRKHYCFNGNNSIINKSLIPMSAEKLLELDINLLTSGNNNSKICLNKKDPVQRKHLFFNKYFKELSEQQPQSLVVKMPKNYLSFYKLQSIKNHLVNIFENNCIVKKHLRFNEDGHSEEEIESFTLEEFLDKNMKISCFRSNHKNMKNKHFWFNEDGKIIDEKSHLIKPKTFISDNFPIVNNNIDGSKEVFNTCSTNEPLFISKDDQKRNFSFLDNKDLMWPDQFTSLKNKEEKDFDFETRSLPFFKLEPNTEAQIESNIKLVNDSFSVKDQNDSLLSFKNESLDSFHEDIDILDVSRDSRFLLNSDCKKPFFRDGHFPSDNFIKPSKAKVSTTPIEDFSFLKLTFDGDVSKFFRNKTEMILEEEKKCPIIFCQMKIKLPNKHFKQHHPQLPKWKKNACLTLIHLKSQDKSFLIHKCIFCNSSEVDINHHLCQTHRLYPNTKLSDEIKSQCEKIFLNSDELFYETILDAFRSFKQSHGFKRRAVAKQVSFLKYLLSGLSYGSMSERIFIGRLLASNIYPIVNILFMQKHSLNRMIQKQLKILRNFLRFLHSNSDIFALVDKSWHENVLPSWNVLEINENQLVLVSCKV